MIRTYLTISTNDNDTKIVNPKQETKKLKSINNSINFFSIIWKQIDPCLSNTIKEDQYKRSSSYTIQSTDIAISDNFLSEGWYRFNSGGAGNDMVTWAPSIYQCGTIYPMWLNGMY